MENEFYEIEKRWQNEWFSKGIFNSQPSDKKKFFLTVPYPYTSGALHIGHGRSYSMGDVVARHYRHKGFNVLWPMAFHVSGMPILAISDLISRGDKKTIELYKQYVALYEKDPKKVEEIVKSFSKPENVAEYFSSKISEDFKSIGLSIDWTRSFNTMQPIYNKFVEWQFLKLKEKGYLTKGEHPVLFSTKDKNSVGEDDIKDGDTNPVEIVEFVSIFFEFEDGFILASTLRPETIFGITNIWVNPEARYVKAKMDDKIIYVSKEAFEKLSFQRDVELLRELNGDYFLNKKAKAPLVEREVPILPGKFVDPDNATGFVYSVPAHAPYDFVALKDWEKETGEKIEMIKIIEHPGKSLEEIISSLGISSQEDKEKLDLATKEVYKLEFYEGKMLKGLPFVGGMKVKEAKEKVRELLIDEGKAIIFYETSRKAVTRAGDKVVVAIIKDQWFIDYSKEEWKEKARKCLDKMIIYPEKYRKAFYDTLDWLHERPCTRKRGLGTKFPFDKEWVIESLSDSTIYMAFYTIVRIIKERNIKAESLIPEVFDYVFLNKGNPEEVSKKSGIPLETLEEMKKEFEYYYPNDLRHTAIAHIQNHLTFFILNHVAIFPEKHWPKGITLNNMVIREGVKMSKSKGNVIPLREVSKKYGADLFRLYVYSFDHDSIVDWREKDVQSYYEKLKSWFYLMKIKPSQFNPETLADRWILSRFYSSLKEYYAALDNFNYREACQKGFFLLLKDIRKYEKMVEKEKFKKFLGFIAEDWIIALNTIIPHLTEELWHYYGNNTFASLEHYREIKEEFIDKDAELSFSLIEDLNQDLSDLKNILKRDSFNKIRIIVASEKKRRFYELLEKNINREVKELAEVLKPYWWMDEKKLFSFLATIKKKRKLPKAIVSQDFEINAIKSFSNYLKEIQGLREIVVEKEEESNSEKAIKAIPFKPAIEVEE